MAFCLALTVRFIGNNMISYDMSNEDYHNSVGISKSGLDLIAVSPAHFDASFRYKRKSIPAFLIGSAAHCAILEANEFDDRYGVLDADKRTKAGKEAHEYFKQSGKESLTPFEYDMVMNMQKSVWTHPLAKSLLQNGDPEVSCLEKRNGVHVRARADYLRKDGIIVDLKTTQSASENEFSNSVAKFNYHRQAAWYMDLYRLAGMDIDNFYFICVEKEPPYAVAVYELDAFSIQKGSDECIQLLNIYKDCLEKDHWPAYSQEIKTIKLPAWR